MAQEVQLGLERQSPRALQINPPTGFLRLASEASSAPSLRGGWDVWQTSARQALELTAGLRFSSERQLTYENSAGASGGVRARLKLDTQWTFGALYRFERPFDLPLEAGLGLEARRERLVMKEGDLTSAGILNRLWLRAAMRRRFQQGGFGPFVALECALPLSPAPTPSGVDYLLDLDHLGSSLNPGTSATAHAPTFSLTVAVGYRFGRRPAAPQVSTDFPHPEPLEILPVARSRETPPEVSLVPFLKPASTPARPEVIVLDEAALHFALDRAEIPPQGLEVLKTWAARLRALEQVPVLAVAGHSDATGRRSHNLRLSLSRALAVAEVLKAEGLSVKQVEGLGPDRPLASNETLEGRATNRRVEIRLEAGQLHIQTKGQASSDLVPEPSKFHKLPKK